MYPYINFDTSEWYHRAVGIFVGEFCAVGVIYTANHNGWRFGIIVLNISFGVHG